jgi:hypothetical protein
VERPSALDSWSAEDIALGRRWVQAWKDAGPRLDAIRRRELRETDPYEAIARLCGPADFTVCPAHAAADIRSDRAAAPLRSRTPDVNAVIAAAAELQAICEAEAWEFCLIGGVALERCATSSGRDPTTTPVESRGCARSWRSSFFCC